MKAAALLLAVAAAACEPGLPVGPASPTAPSGPDRVASRLEPGPASAVVALAPDVATPIVAGPFAVTSINPGTSIDLAIVPGPACPADAAWFAYSGGGVAVGRGAILCARSTAGVTHVHAFSGHD